MQIFLLASQSSDGIPVGTIIMRTTGFLSTAEGSKYLLCDGSLINSTLYPKLASLMSNTPNLINRVPQGAGQYITGTTIEAGLPNITGIARCGYATTWYYSFTGPFYQAGGYGALIEAGRNGNTMNLGFDASKCSPVYRNDINTVQPPALAVNFYIKAK
ncbi:MAG: phage tail protein [Clostridium sp.]|nr:phage tail protein [Clostridium sp.]